MCNSEEIDLHQSEGDKCKMCNKDFSNYVQVIVASNGNKYEYKIDEAGHIDLPEDVMTNPTSNVYNRVYSDRACTQPIDDLTFTKRTKVYLARYNVNHLLSYNCTFSVANGQATLTKVVNFFEEPTRHCCAQILQRISRNGNRRKCIFKRYHARSDFT